MNFITNDVETDWFPHRPVWTYREKTGLPNNKFITAFAERHQAWA